MQRQRKSESAIRTPVTVFPFSAIGLGLILAALVVLMSLAATDCFQSGNGSSGMGLLASALGMCLAFGGGMLAIYLREKRKYRSAGNPTPWVHRADWAKGEIAASENVASPVALAMLGMAVIGISVFLFLWPQSSGNGDGIKWVLLLLGSGFSCFAVYLGALRRKFGKSFFKLARVPGEIGGRLEGAVHIGCRFGSQTVFRHQLECLKLETRGSGNDSQTVGVPVWQSVKVCAKPHAEPGACSRVQIMHAIPANVPETQPQIIWQLTLQAELPGLKYSSRFEVPVFQVQSAEENAAAIVEATK